MKPIRLQLIATTDEAIRAEGSATEKRKAARQAASTCDQRTSFNPEREIQAFRSDFVGSLSLRR